ncbi:MAG: GTP-binding protein [Treponema sp.]
MKAKIPMTLLCGYLGAGKTTLLNKVLNNQKGYKVAVIVNDIGEVNVDASLIAKGGQVTDTSSIVPLTNGCICCTLKTQLALQIEELIKSGKYDYIMIEASGVCEPMPIAQELETITVGKLDNVVGVVDAARMVEEFAGGEKLLNKKMEADDIESLLVQQVEFCSTLIINKKDLVTEEQMKKVRAVISTLHPGINIIETSHGDVPVEKILDTNSFDFDKVFESAGWCKVLEQEEEEGEEHVHKAEGSSGSDEDEYGISTFVYLRRRPFNRAKLESYFDKWPKTIIRSKGLVWLDDDQDNSLILETTGRQITAGYAGQWLASCPKKVQEQEMKKDPRLRKDWDEKVGDRMIRLCIIGQNMDKEKITSDLDSLLGEA